MGRLVWWRKGASSTISTSKLEALRRMQDEGLSCRQAAALFNIRRLDLVAEWSRLYAAHEAAALQLGWKWEKTRMSKPSSRRDDREAVTNDQRSREELLRDLQQLRAENAYLKKVQALARTKSRSAPVMGLLWQRMSSAWHRSASLLTPIVMRSGDLIWEAWHRQSCRCLRTRMPSTNHSGASMTDDALESGLIRSDSWRTFTDTG
jgi:hypothetical protein